MGSSLTSRLVLLALVAGPVWVCGCSSSSGAPRPAVSGSGGDGAGSGGIGSGSGGDRSGSGGTTGSGGTMASDGAAGANPDMGTGWGGMSGDGDTGGLNLGADVTRVVPTSGCGQDPGHESGVAVPGTVLTMGSKAADCADSSCGDWSYEREYFVTLPQGYNRTKAYPLIVQGPGCGETGKGVYSLDNNLDNTVIRVGLTPPPHAIGHATLPSQGCFDDHEGDDSVDWVFYENLYDKLATLYCFDRNRVFAAGRGTGAMFANELGCRYAGDATRPIRGIMPHSGGLPTEAQFVPTCTTRPMAGIWIHVVADTMYLFAGTKVAIARAMQVNGCTIGTSYETAQFVDVPIGGGLPDNLCKRITGCPALYPLVVCPLAGDERGTRENVVNPAVSAFVKMFATP